MNTIDQEWDEFVVDMDLMGHNPVVFAAARLAFYSGAAVALELAQVAEGATDLTILDNDAEAGISRATEELVALTRKH